MGGFHQETWQTRKWASCGDRIILHLDCGGAYTNQHMTKSQKNINIHTNKGMLNWWNLKSSADCTNSNILILILCITNSYTKYYHWGKQSERYAEPFYTFLATSNETIIISKENTETRKKLNFKVLFKQF